MDEAYFSHIPLLSAAVITTSGPVLELGAGLGSTLMLHGLCGGLGRQLTTVESNEDWLLKFINYGRSWHTLKLVSDFSNLSEYQESFGLAFVDHGIAEQRGLSVERLKDVPILVAHDTCHPWLYNYEPILSQFKYRWDYKMSGPMVTVVSDTVDVARKFAEMGL